MRRRLRKQLTVVAILVAFFGFLGTGIWGLVYEPPLPPPPPPPTYEALQVLETKLFPTAPGRADLFAIAKNPNGEAGVAQVPYTFEVRAGTAVVASIRGQSFFLPGQEKPIAIINVAVPETAETVALTFGDAAWVPVEPDFRGASLVVVSREGRFTRPAAGRAAYEVKGVIANESDVDYLTVEITVLGLDLAGEVVGVGRTFVGSLLALERREFTVSWPVPTGVSVARTKEFPEVNAFSPAAILLRPGVPGREPAPVAPTPTS